MTIGARASDWRSDNPRVKPALWIGRLSPKKLELVDEGQTYLFPRDESGRVVYCNIEGVAWVTPSRFVVVSDKRKPGEQYELPLLGI
jgi:hypothetical protein